MYQIEPNILQTHNATSFKSFCYKTIADIEEINSYLPIPHCLLEHVITNTKLSCADKLIFLYIYSRSFFSYGKNKDRTIASSLRNISETLCISKSQVLASQRKLEQLDLLSIIRQKNKYNQSKPNLITPYISNNLFASLNKSQNKIGVDGNFNKQESNLDYLERNKQFINFNHGILKFFLGHQDLSASNKILAIDLFTMWYKYHLSSNKTSSFKFIINYQQLILKHNCSLKSISTKLIILEERGIISRKQIFAKNGEEQNARHDKSIWEITFNFPNWYKDIQAPNSLHTDTLYDESIENELLTTGENLKSSISNIVSDTNSVNSFDEDSGIIDELIDKLKSFKQNIPSFIKHSDDLNAKNKEKSPNSDAMSVDFSKNTSPSSNTDDLAVCYKNDPGLPKNDPLYNRDIIIKNFKSNLRGFSKVLFDKFLNKIGITSLPCGNKEQNKEKRKCFSITSELIKRLLRGIPKNKADKARKYAYALISKKLAKGYAASLNKHELAKQLIFHIATWKPTQLGELNKNQEIDTALSVAWKAIIAGTWQIPLGYAKAQILNYEFISYKNKYKNYDVLSPELYLLEKETDKLFGGYSNLAEILKKEVEAEREVEHETLLLEHHDNEEKNPFESSEQEFQNSKINFTHQESLVVDSDYAGLSAESKLESQLEAGFSYTENQSCPVIPIFDELDCLDNCLLNTDDENHLITKKQDFMDKSLSLLEADLPDQISYFGELERVVTDNQGNVHVLFAASSSDEFLQIQKQHKEFKKLNNESLNPIRLIDQELGISSILPLPLDQKEELLIITPKLRDNDTCISVTSSKETLSNRFTEIDILHLNQEERLYKIYGTKTDKLAVEGVNNSTFFGELKEMEHCSDGKLRVVFGVEYQHYKDQ